MNPPVPALKAKLGGPCVNQRLVAGRVIGKATPQIEERLTSCKVPGGTIGQADFRLAELLCPIDRERRAHGEPCCQRLIRQGSEHTRAQTRRIFFQLFRSGFPLERGQLWVFLQNPRIHAQTHRD